MTDVSVYARLAAAQEEADSLLASIRQASAVCGIEGVNDHETLVLMAETINEQRRKFVDDRG